jgi:hypothetical protein
MPIGWSKTIRRCSNGSRSSFIVAPLSRNDSRDRPQLAVGTRVLSLIDPDMPLVTRIIERPRFAVSRQIHLSCKKPLSVGRSLYPAFADGLLSYTTRRAFFTSRLKFNQARRSPGVHGTVSARCPEGGSRRPCLPPRVNFQPTLMSRRTSTSISFSEEYFIARCPSRSIEPDIAWPTMRSSRMRRLRRREESADCSDTRCENQRSGRSVQVDRS